MIKSIKYLFLYLHTFSLMCCCMEKTPSNASLSAIEGIESVLFERCDRSCLGAFSNFGVDQSDGDLYVNAINVGQGNFIILRKGNHAVILDAGGRLPFEDIEIKLYGLLQGVIIDAVFITHPHKDHFSLFYEGTSLLETYEPSFLNTVFYLGGTERDWTSNSSKKFLETISCYKKTGRVQFLDNSSQEIFLLGGDVVFRTFQLESPVFRTPNKLSLLLQVSFMGKNLLFTGDAEGDSLSRLFQVESDLSSAKNLIKDDKPFIEQLNEAIKQLHIYTDARKEFLELRYLYRSLLNILSNYISSNSTSTNETIPDFVRKYSPNDINSFTQLKNKLYNINNEFNEFFTDPSVSSLFFLINEKLERIIAKTASYILEDEDLLELSSPNFSSFSEKYFLAYQHLADNNIVLNITDIFLESLLEHWDSIVIDETNQSVEELFRISAQNFVNELLLNDATFHEVVIDQVIPFLDEILEPYERAQLAELAGLKKYTTKMFQSFIRNSKEQNNDLFFNIFTFPVIMEKLKTDKKFLPYVRINFLKTYCHDSINELLIKYHSDLMKKLINLRVNRCIFKNANVVFLPHHGANTKNSQNILGLFAGRNILNEPRLFIVSSSPFGIDKLPKASTLEMAPFYPQHPSHKFLYCRDYLYSINSVQILDTKKPIYLTGASPTGVVTVKIEKSGTVSILDMIPRKDKKCCRWINVEDGNVLQ